MLWDFCHVPIDEAKLYGVVCFQSLPKNKKNISFYLLFAFYLKHYSIHNIQKFKLSKVELRTYTVMLHKFEVHLSKWKIVYQY